jgi:hypothetical protein
MILIEKEVNDRWMDRWGSFWEVLLQTQVVVVLQLTLSVQYVVCVWYSVCIQRVAAINHNNHDNSTWLVNIGQAVVMRSLSIDCTPDVDL